nr:hypothetical protein [Kibdelosporangium sp. MJ126-NF4]
MSTANRVGRPRVGFPLGGLPSGEDILFGPRANSTCRIVSAEDGQSKWRRGAFS